MKVIAQQEKINLYTRLMKAISDDNTEEIDKLLRQGVPVNFKNELTQKTPLMYAAEKGRNKSVSYLLSLPGIKLNTRDTDGKSAFIYAILSGRADIVELLMIKQAKIKTKDNAGKTALMYAAETGNVEIMKLILEKLENKNQEINAQDNQGKTVFDYVKKGDSEILNLLKQVSPPTVVSFPSPLSQKCKTR